jgi:hypothetical protein
MAKNLVKNKLHALLNLARELAATPGMTWVDANNAIYSPRGPYARLFVTPEDRAAFEKSPERKQIDDLIDSLPEPPLQPISKEYSGKFNVRIPKSLHAALALEAEDEGVSLNQLVLTKLAAKIASFSPVLNIEPAKPKAPRRSGRP